jgi:hypothetical protein
VAVALAIALTAAVIAWTMAQRPLTTQDFAFYWRGARYWLGGVDPYAMRPYTVAWPLGDRLFYPLPALLALSPIAWLPQPVAAAIFAGVPSSLLAWRLSRDGLWPLLALASPGYIMAVVLGQWAPWLMLAMLVPSLGFVFTAKPTLGVACFAYRPTWRAFGLGLVILTLSLLLMPRWPLEWFDNVRSVVGHPAPIFTLAGCWLWLATLRWQSQEARLLLAFAFVPQLLFFADQAPLAFVAKSSREAVCLTVAGWLAAGCWYARHYATPEAVPMAALYVLVGCYLPALYLVLRRPRVC